MNLLCGCEIWLSGEHRLRVLENGMLWEIFVTKGEEMKERCRKWQNTGLHNLYSSLNIIRGYNIKEGQMSRRLRETMNTKN
jgi:hypothetical protein